MIAPMTVRQSKEVARDAAQRILDAVSTFSPWVRIHLATALAADGSDTLRSIGAALLDKDPVSRMAGGLYCDVFIGDAEAVAADLGDEEPWGTIRAALEDIIAAWRAAHPGWRTTHDRSAMWQMWEQAIIDRAAAAELDKEASEGGE